jgi:hypothetical protein
MSATIEPEPFETEPEAIREALGAAAETALGEWAETALLEGVENAELDP